MNRRKFLQQLCGGAVAVAVATHIPLQWVPQPVRREGAINFLASTWRAFMKGKSSSECPDVMYAGGDLWDAYASEIVPMVRFTDTPSAYTQPTLMFKAARLIRSADSGWWVRFKEND